jgi:hypothetical protein
MVLKKEAGTERGLETIDFVRQIGACSSLIFLRGQHNARDHVRCSAGIIRPGACWQANDVKYTAWRPQREPGPFSCDWAENPRRTNAIQDEQDITQSLEGSPLNTTQATSVLKDHRGADGIEGPTASQTGACSRSLRGRLRRADAERITARGNETPHAPRRRRRKDLAHEPRAGNLHAHVERHAEPADVDCRRRERVCALWASSTGGKVSCESKEQSGGYARRSRRCRG